MIGFRHPSDDSGAQPLTSASRRRLRAKVFESEDPSGIHFEASRHIEHDASLLVFSSFDDGDDISFGVHEKIRHFCASSADVAREFEQMLKPCFPEFQHLNFMQMALALVQRTVRNRQTSTPTRCRGPPLIGARQ